METFEAFESRASRRAFLQKQVDQNTLEKIVNIANRSPSYMNTQPWELYVLSGDEKDKLAAKLSSDILKGVPLIPDMPFPTMWPPPHEERFTRHRMRRFKALGIDPEKQQDEVIASYRNNFKFFDAPSVVVLTMDKRLTPWSIFDCGAFVHGSACGSRRGPGCLSSGGAHGLCWCDPVAVCYPRSSHDRNLHIGRLPGPGFTRQSIPLSAPRIR